VVYDTGSDWLTLETDFCNDCNWPYFITAKSNTYKNTSNSLQNLAYGSANLLGVQALDNIGVSG